MAQIYGKSTPDLQPNMPRLWQIQIVGMAEAIAVIPDFMPMWSNMSFNWD